MKISVGSKNQNKVQAVKEAFQDFPEYANIEVSSVDVDSMVSNQPKSLEETTQGAINRAKNAFINCDYSVGLESGLLAVPQTKSGYMDITMCAIYDGKNFHLGGSSTFEYPKSLINLVFEKGYDINQAAQETGFTDDPKVGNAQGMVGILSRGVLDRKSYSKQAVTTALIHLLNPKHY